MSKDMEKMFRRFLNSECTAEEQTQLQQYFQQYGLTEEKPEEDTAYFPTAAQSIRMQAAVMQSIGKKRSRSILSAIPVWTRRAAAVLLPFILLTMVFIRLNNKNSQSVAITTRIANTGKTVKYIRLSDSSEIWLNKGASIAFDETSFSTSRNITLNGEAYFQVTHDAVHPFRLQTGQLYTTVLGTSFSVNADPVSGQTFVALLSGKVQVAEAGTMGRILKPGEAVMYNHHNKQLQPAQLPFYFLAWKNKVLTCNNEPLKNIIQYLSNYYGQPIRLEAALQNLKYSGSLTLEPGLPVVLNRLLFVHQLHYKTRSNDILIY